MWVPHPNINQPDNDPLQPTAPLKWSVDEKENGELRGAGKWDRREESGGRNKGKRGVRERIEEGGEEKGLWVRL